MWIAKGMWLLSFGWLGCASIYQPSPVHIVSQTNAPVQIVGIAARDYSLLGSVVVKNTTDRFVDSFEVVWSIYSPAKCRDSDPRLREVTRHGQIVYAERRGIWKPRGALWPARPLVPHETTRITVLHLTPEELSELEQKYGARKVAVQIAILYVNYEPSPCNSHSGCTHTWPDWRDDRLERTQILDAENAASQACGQE
jgi:hypothetical protein